MREGALFGTMFGLGAGAVLVGVVVSRLVVGQAPERPAEEPSAAVEVQPTNAEPKSPVVVSPVAEPPAVVSSAVPPPVVAPVVEPPQQPATLRRHRAVVRKHRRPPVEETPLATASVPSGEAETVVPSPAGVDHPPIAVVRGGATRSIAGSRASGPHIIQVDPQDDGR